MKYSIAIASLIFFYAVSYSQQKSTGSISGQIKDIQNEPLAGVTVQLLFAADTSIVQSVISASNGRFGFYRLARGNYLLTASAIGFRKYISAPVSVENDQARIQLPLIVITREQSKALKTVVVTAQKPLIEQEIDRTIVNVSAMISAATGNALEVLEKTPGITVDANGEISLNGASGVNVLIDGRPTYLSGRDLAAYLRSLPGSMLDKIELITNPPAKYDAAGGAVINIRLNRKQTRGYSGSISTAYSQGILPRTYNSLNLNYLNKKLNIFGNFGINRHTDTGDEESIRSFVESQKSGNVTMNNHYTILSKELSGRVGLDYFFSKKTIAGVIASINQRRRKDEAVYFTNSFSESRTDSTGTGGNTDRHHWRQSTVNANFQHKFNDAGKEITADINFINYNNKASQLLYNTVTHSDTDIRRKDLYYWLPLSINIFTAKADYSHPLKNKGSISAGLKTSFVENDHQSDYFTKQGEALVPDLGRSNHFIYRESIHAAYVNGRKDWKRIGLQLGLRYEYTDTKGKQLGNAIVADTSFTRNYSSLFPTFYFMYRLDSLLRHSITLSYARRINRPGYQQLNPFLFFRDQYSYVSGNPALGPSYNNRFELIYRYKQLISLNLQFDRNTDGVFNASRMIGNTMISRAENIATRQLIAILFNLNTNPAKWWRMNFHVGIGRFTTKGKLYTENLDLNRNVWRANTLHQFRLGKGWSAELNAAYNSRMINWQRIIAPRYWVNTAVQKKILKGKGSLKLSFDDIFYTTRWDEEIKGIGQAKSVRYGIQDTRRVGISFNFNFGKETFTRKRKYNDNSADDVKDRVQ